MTDLVAASHKETFASAHQRALNGETVSDVDLVLVLDGEETAARATFTPKRDGDTNAVSVLFTVAAHGGC
jgi:hypothetical protein